MAEDPRATLVVAEEDGRVIGYLLATIERDLPIYVCEEYGIVREWWVEPAFRRRGVGKALIGFCENAARQRGMNVHLYTNEKMTDNLSIYPKLGYVEVARRSEDGFNRVYFEKALT